VDPPDSATRSLTDSGTTHSVGSPRQVCRYFEEPEVRDAGRDRVTRAEVRRHPADDRRLPRLGRAPYLTVRGARNLGLVGGDCPDWQEDCEHGPSSSPGRIDSRCGRHGSSTNCNAAPSGSVCRSSTCTGCVRLHPEVPSLRSAAADPTGGSRSATPTSKGQVEPAVQVGLGVVEEYACVARLGKTGVDRQPGTELLVAAFTEAVTAFAAVPFSSCPHRRAVLLGGWTVRCSPRFCTCTSLRCR
jgi:hypothetical protein